MQTGCATMNNTERGAVAGGAVGSIAGTLIGAATGNPKTGAVVGGLGGALVGGAMGSETDREEERRAGVIQAQEIQAYDDAQPYRIAEVVDLVRSGTPENQVINYIKQKQMTFNLSAEDLKHLNEERVPSRVVEVMQTSRGNPVQVQPVRVQAQPTIIREQVIIHEDPFFCPPPPVVFVGPRPVYRPRAGIHFHGRF
jgi:hypothetical protein